MYNTGIRFSSSYRDISNDTVLSNQSGEGKPVSPVTSKKLSPSTVSGLEGEGSDTNSESVGGFSEISSTGSAEGAEKTIFLDQEIQQVEPSALTKRMLSTSYRNSNRGAVVLGLAGGVVGGFFGMSVGSSLGTHLGALSGVIQEYARTPGDETAIADSEQTDHDVAGENHFSEHVIQVVDHAGHHAAMGSIAVGVVALLTSLATGNPMPVAFHAAGVCSGAAWAFGLTTGTAKWLQQHAQRSAETLQREEQTSPGDIELSNWKVVEDSKDAHRQVEKDEISSD
ncbi:MAG: hypothetical protein K2W97_02735 [Chthoniobacterales bacterium]|nr:hypothetical protein [Chthoniobacterales bacterium]